MLEVTVLLEALSIVLAMPINSRLYDVDVYRGNPRHQTNEDRTRVSVTRFSLQFMAIATDYSQYADMSATTLNQCSGTNPIEFCRKGFSTTKDELFLGLTSLFHEYSISALRNFSVDSVSLLEARKLLVWRIVFLTSSLKMQV